MPAPSGLQRRAQASRCKPPESAGDCCVKLQFSVRPVFLLQAQLPSAPSFPATRTHPIAATRVESNTGMSILQSHFVLPLTRPERYAGLPSRLHEIRSFDRRSEREQRQEQQQRLRQLLKHAYQTVPFYRRQFDEARFSPFDARIGEALPLPVLTLQHLRENSHALLSTAYKLQDLRKASTRGTHEMPTEFHRDLDGLRYKTALHVHLNSWSGYHPGDSNMMLWGNHRDLAIDPSWRWRLADAKLLRRASDPGGSVNKAVMERFRLRYEQMRPKILHGYPNALTEFAAYLEEYGIQHRPKAILAPADVLTDANRRFIESVFDQRIYLQYGSRELGMIAAECPEHEGLHFHPWGCYVEFEPIGNTAEGTLYRLLVTDLLNYGQPFIRYDTGDCVTVAHQSCSCGRWFPLITRVLGYIGDAIVLSNGDVIPGTAIGSQISQVQRRFRRIAHVQLVQKSYDHLHLRYAVRSSIPSVQAELQSVRKAIENLVHRPLVWTSEEVANIPRERSGKIQYCVSELTTRKH